MSLNSFVSRKHGGLYAGAQERFSLLLLEFGEVYFEDFTVVYYPYVKREEIEERKQHGRLKVCSHSILFDPLDIRYPVIKVCYKHCGVIKEYHDTAGFLRSDNCLLIKASQYAELLEGGFIGPFNFVKKDERFLFSLTYGQIETVLSKILKLYQSFTLDAVERSQLITHIVQAQHASVSFNTSWLEDLHEKILVETSGERIAPLVSNPGRIMLTSSRMYFQPYNNVELEPVIKIKLSDMRQLSKRRYLLKHVGIEIFAKSGHHIFLAFNSEEARDSLIELILIQQDVKLEDVPLNVMTNKWQIGAISNYDYLLYLNNQASRTFSDLTQYPVFPWVIIDYTSDVLDLNDPKTFRDLSKPIGALNEKRLSYFKERYEAMSDKPFLYGSHYSAPGYILFYLVRLGIAWGHGQVNGTCSHFILYISCVEKESAPEYLLCLQGGRFDHPNRLFHGVAQTWNNVLHDHVDLKELIPEFYQPPGDFLLNRKSHKPDSFEGIDFGVRSDGEKIDDVILPPWASSPVDFTTKCREALESNYVSEHLNHWIDLIFGYKQRGKEAVRANNVFYYLAYEGGIDLDKITDPDQYAALEQQIREFGQIPDQLFTEPHPPKKVQNAAMVDPVEHLNINVSEQCQIDQPTVQTTPTNSNLSSPWYNLINVVQHHCYKLHKEEVTALKLSPDGNTIFSVSQDKSLKIFSIAEKIQKRSATISNLPLSTLDINVDGSLAVVGSWDNNVYTYSVDFGTVVNTNYAHDNSVTCVCWKGNILATGSLDCTVKIWEISSCIQGSKTSVPILKVEFDHENEITCLDVDAACKFAAVGISQGNVLIWDIEDGTKIGEYEDHSPHPVHHVSFNKDGTSVLSCATDCSLKLTDILAGTVILTYSVPSIIRCFVWDDVVVVAGTEAGDAMIIQLHPLPKTLITFGKSSGAITKIDVSQDASTIVFGTTQKTIEIWTTKSA